MSGGRGTDTSDLALDDPADYDDARYSADMIKEAMDNLHRSDRLSGYERRMALREVKDILRQLLDDTQTVPSSLKVDSFLKRDENADTVEQLVVLREEMLRLMRHAENLGTEITRLCNKLAAVWDVACHSPTDLLEVKVKSAPGSIPPCPLSLNVLQSMLDAWTMVAGVSEDASSFAGVDITTLLQGCGVRDSIAKEIVASVANSPQEERALVARITGSLTELEAIQGCVAALDRQPQIPRNLEERSAAGVAAQEEWLRKAKDAAARIKNWEMLSGIPFESSAGPSLYLARGTLEPRRTDTSRATFADELRSAIEQTERNGC